MIRIFIDHDFNHKILRGLNQRIPELDFITADQLGKKEVSDENHLEWALENLRVILTHDVNTFTDAAYKKLKNDEEIFVLIIVPQDMPIGDAIDELEIIIGCSDETEYKNRIEFLPLDLI